MRLIIKTNDKDITIPGVPSFKSADEAYVWANAEGLETLNNLFKKSFDRGVIEFTVDYS